MPLTQFDFIEAFDIEYLADIFHSKNTENDELNICDQVISLGYPSHNPLLNLGFMAILNMIYITKLFIFTLIVYPIFRKFGRLKKYKRMLMYQLFFNDLLVLFIEGYLELILAGLLIEKVPENNQDNNPFMLGVGYYYLFVTMFLIPGLLGWLFHLSLRKIKSKYIMKRFKYIFKQLKMKNKQQAMYYGFFVFRRSIYMLTYKYFVDYPFF